MTVKPILLALALAAASSAAKAQVVVYAGDRAIAAAQADAKSASFACEKQLQAQGRSGGPAPACARYHAAVLKSMTLDRKRQAWCNAQFATEASNIRVPDSCLGQKSPDLRIDAVEGLERKVSPATWKAFDKQMESLP